MSKKDKKIPTSFRGRYAYHGKDDKKKKPKDIAKLLSETSKKIAMQCDCNHIDRKKDKCYFEDVETGERIHPNDFTGYAMRCSICGQIIYTDDDYINHDAIERAKNQIITIYSRLRNRVPMTEKTYRSISKALEFVAKAPDIVDALDYMDEHSGKKGFMSGKDRKKDKKKKKKNDDEYRGYGKRIKWMR